MAVIEVARSVLQWQDADSEEFNKDTQNPGAALLVAQQSIALCPAHARV